MSDELEERLDQLEQEVMDELNSKHHPYKTITHYKCSLTLNEDEVTEVIIKSKTAGVCFATSPEDALQQTKSANLYSKQTYASHLLNFVSNNLRLVDMDNVEVIYTEEPTIAPMPDEEIAEFQREIISLNGF